MPFNPKSLRLLILITPLVVLLSFVSSGFAQMPDLEVRVGDTTGTSGQHNSVISVYMNNFATRLPVLNYGFSWIDRIEPYS